jgi:hypothetical protein
MFFGFFLFSQHSSQGYWRALIRSCWCYHLLTGACVWSGEAPRPELRHHSRISGACLDAAMGLIPHLTIKGTKVGGVCADYPSCCMQPQGCATLTDEHLQVPNCRCKSTDTALVAC